VTLFVHGAQKKSLGAAASAKHMSF